MFLLLHHLGTFYVIKWLVWYRGAVVLAQFFLASGLSLLVWHAHLELVVESGELCLGEQQN